MPKKLVKTQKDADLIASKKKIGQFKSKSKAGARKIKNGFSLKMLGHQVLQPKINRKNQIELVAIDFSEKDDKKLSQEIMSQMISVGFLHIVNVPGFNEKKLMQAMTTFHSLP